MSEADSDINERFWWVGCLIPALGAAFLLYNCSQSDDSGDFSDRVNGRVAVEAALRDGASAEFSNTFISAQGNYCGYVNAKNGFGGMAGNQRFVVIGSVAVLEESVPSFEELWRDNCATNSKNY